VELPPPIKNAGTRKHFRSIVLPNGLTALLVHDSRPQEDSPDGSDVDETDEEEEADDEDCSEEYEDMSTEGDEEDGEDDAPQMAFNAAAALCVEAGSLSDPENCQGLMHLLEHMVFMGSKKYPKENDFDDYVAKRGGYSNASTDLENTNFYFEVQSKHLWKALDKFAQFFVEPLISKNSLDREIKAVDSEATEARTKDYYRAELVMQKLIPASHPASFINWGDINTLRVVDPDTLHQMLHEYRRRFYVPSIMTLVVVSREPLDVMQQEVVEIFSQIPASPLGAPDYASLPPLHPYPSKYVQVEALEAKTVLDLSWGFPPMKKKEDYKRQPYNFISALMGHEGKGSLLSYLQSKQLAYSVETDSSMSNSCYESLKTEYSVSIKLNSIKDVPEVIAAVFYYLKMIGIPPKSCFDEFSLIAEEAFQCSVDEDSGDFAETVANLMTLYAPEDFIRGNQLFFDYDPELISKVLSELTPENLSICLTAKFDDFSGDDVLTEPFFGTRYKINDVPSDWLTRFKSPVPEGCSMHLPPPNKYLDPKHPVFTPNWPVPTEPDIPQEVECTGISGARLWRAFAHNYGLPLASVHLRFQLRDSLFTENKYAHETIALILSHLELKITEEKYDAALAKYAGSWTYTQRGLQLSTSGFSTKYEEFLSMLISPFRDSSYNSVDIEDRRNIIMRELYDQAVDPSNCQRQLLSFIGSTGTRMAASLLAGLQHVTAGDVAAMAPQLLRGAGVDALAQGVGADELSTTLLPNLQQHFPREGEPVLKPLPGYRLLPLGSHTVLLEPINRSNGNSAVTNYYQGRQGKLRDQVIMNLLELALQEPCFNILRTQDQLGYIVDCFYTNTSGMLGFNVLVEPQASKHSVAKVDARIEEFLKGQHKCIKAMKSEELATLKETLATSLSRVEESLEQEAERHWGEITSTQLLFDRKRAMVALVDKISKKELVKMFERLFDPKQKAFYRKISIQIPGVADEDKVNCPPSMKEVQDAGDSFIKLTEDKTQMFRTKYVTDLNKFIEQLEVKPYHPIVS